MMLAKLDPKNIHGLAYWELGFRNITNSRRPINKVCLLYTSRCV